MKQKQRREKSFNDLLKICALAAIFCALIESLLTIFQGASSSKVWRVDKCISKEENIEEANEDMSFTRVDSIQVNKM